jgi:glycosyltransferase involved in cell wall biosynthesis
VVHSQAAYLLSASLVAAAQDAGVPTVVELHDYWFFCPRIQLLRSDGRLCTGRVTAAECAWCLMAERRRYRWLDALTNLADHRRLGRGLSTTWMRWASDSQLTADMAARRRYLDTVLCRAERIVTTAPQLRDMLLAQVRSPWRVRLIRSGLDAGTVTTNCRAASQDHLRIGYLGQLAPHKGVHLAIKAYRQLSASGRRLQLSIHGDTARFPRYVARLRRLARGAQGVQLCGTFSNHQVGRLLAELDVVVVPSLWYEVHPLVILEAFAARVPVVASRFPNLESMVEHGKSGLLFTPGDAEDLARQLQRLLDEPDFLQRLSDGIGPVRTIDEEMREIEGIYREVAAAGITVGQGQVAVAGTVP